MMKFYRIKYDDLINYYDDFLSFALKKSDYFSVITYLLKPYSKSPPNCEYDNKLQLLNSHLKTQIVGIKCWSNNGTKDNHTVMNVYNSNKCIENIIRPLGCFLLPEENDLPEDICFYKGNTIWISTVSHEKMAFLYSSSKEEIDFFEFHNIHYYIENSMEIYHLPKPY